MPNGRQNNLFKRIEKRDERFHPAFFLNLSKLNFVFKEKDMLHVISPAKSLDYETQIPQTEYSVPSNLNDAEKIIHKLQKTSAKRIKEMMGISDALVHLNKERYDNWEGKNQISESSRPAIFAFKGDVYLGLDAYSLKDEALQKAQSELRILSGLYGLLKPLDIIEPYRLEMGTKIKIGRKENLYQYWNSSIAKQLAKELDSHQEKVLINLASNEYFKAIDKKAFPYPIISPEFKDAKNGKYKIISFFAKKARGMMSRYILDNNIEKPEDLLGFNYGNYRYNLALSTADKPIFTREEHES